MKLKKELNFLDIFCISTGAMISSGLFILPGIAHSKTGSSVIISYFIAGLFALCGVLSQIELGTAMPKAGGSYFYVTRTLGPAIGTIQGILTWLSIALKSAFALVGMATFTKLFINYDLKIISIVLCIIFVVINVLGVKEASKLQIILVIILLVSLIVYVVFGITKIKTDNFTPFVTDGFMGIISTSGLVFVAYGGLINTVSLAEEVKNPGKVIPSAMILSLVVTTILYVLVVLVTTGVIDSQHLNNSMTPISDGGFVVMGNFGKILLSIGAMLAFITTANAGVMMAARYPFALSRDNLIPGFFKNINSRFKTPHFSILLTGIFMILVLLLDLEILVKTASSVLMISNILSIIAVIVIRMSKIQNYKPSFKSPFFPVLEIIGLASFFFLLYDFGILAFIIGLILFVIGFLLYFFYGRKKSSKEFAILHILERFTSKILTNRKLENELKEIILERDEIKKDRFDNVMEDAIVLDIENTLDVEKLFGIISEKLSLILNIKKDFIFKLLKQREKESTTALNDFIAIPHIVIPGRKIFKALLVRSREGIYFSNDNREIKAVFVFAGSKDERNFHLKYLAGIAQIFQDQTFEDNWIIAKNEEDLRDLVLLSKRKRY